MVFDLSATSFYGPNDTLGLFPTYVFANNAITWSEIVTQNIRTRKLIDTFKPTQSVTVDRTIINLSLNDFYPLFQHVNKTAIELSIIDGLMQWDRVVIPTWAKIKQSIGLVDVMSGYGAKGPKDHFTPAHAVVCNVIRSLILTDTSVYHNGLAITTSLGSGYVMPVFPPIVPATKVTFTYGSFTFQVRKPDFDNSTSLEFSRVNRRTRGGDLVIYRDDIWPESETLKMSFTLLSESEKSLFQDLFQMSLGNLVRYDDYWGQAWSGIILNPQEPIVSYGIGRNSVKIQLQGGRL